MLISMPGTLAQARNLLAEEQPCWKLPGRDGEYQVQCGPTVCVHHKQSRAAVLCGERQVDRHYYPHLPSTDETPLGNMSLHPRLKRHGEAGEGPAACPATHLLASKVQVRCYKADLIFAVMRPYLFITISTEGKYHCVMGN